MQTAQLEKLRKLRTLANFLDDLPHDRFCMGNWADDDYTEHSCGTAACITGWAGTIFAREGWRFEDEVPEFNGQAGEHALVEFFGITLSEAEALAYLWGDGDELPDINFEDCTPRIAADRVRKVIARYAPELLTEEPTSCAAPTALHRFQELEETPERVLDAALDGLIERAVGKESEESAPAGTHALPSGSSPFAHITYPAAKAVAKFLIEEEQA